MFVPVQTPHVSPRARELGLELADVIRRFHAEDPATRPVDVRQAFHVASQELRGEMGGMDAQARKIAAICIGLGLAAFVGCMMYMERVAKSEGGQVGVPWIMIAIVGFVALGGIFALIMAKTRG